MSNGRHYPLRGHDIEGIEFHACEPDVLFRRIGTWLEDNPGQGYMGVNVSYNFDELNYGATLYVDQFGK